MKRKRCQFRYPKIDFFWEIPETQCKKLALEGKRFCKRHLRRKKITITVDPKRTERKRAKRKKEKADRARAHETLRLRKKNARSKRS